MSDYEETCVGKVFDRLETGDRVTIEDEHGAVREAKVRDDTPRKPPQAKGEPEKTMIFGPPEKCNFLKRENGRVVFLELDSFGSFTNLRDIETIVCAEHGVWGGENEQLAKDTFED